MKDNDRLKNYSRLKEPDMITKCNVTQDDILENSFSFATKDIIGTHAKI